MKILQRDDTEHGVDYVKLSDVQLALSDAQSSQCDWKEDDEGYWETSCRRFMCFEHAPPNEQGYKFCHSCGKPIKFIEHEQEPPFEDFGGME